MRIQQLALILALAGLTVTSPLSAMAEQSDQFKAHEILTNAPNEVEHGSIRVDEDISEEALVDLASISIEKAINAARQSIKGKIISAELEEEEGFLVWEVEVVSESNETIELKIDAGTGKLLAAEQDEEDAWWQLWD